MKKHKTKVWFKGPFCFYRCVTDYGETLNISLIAYENAPWGWEWGYSDPLVIRTPRIDFRIGKLSLLYYEYLGKGFEFRLLGFWLLG